MLAETLMRETNAKYALNKSFHMYLLTLACMFHISHLLLGISLFLIELGIIFSFYSLEIIGFEGLAYFFYFNFAVQYQLI